MPTPSVSEPRLWIDGHPGAGPRWAGQAWLAVPAIGILITALAFRRSFPGFGVETDYIYTFVSEAQRILCREPLILQWHPPLYSFALAMVYLAVGDWFSTGLMVSILSSLVAMSCGFLLVQRLLGPDAGAGALLAFAASAPFLTLSATASSDVFFLALFLASVLTALHAIERPSVRGWVLCGVLVGCSLLTRSNALTLAALVAAPLLVQAPNRRRLQYALCCGCGLLIPVLLWVVYARATGSPLAPTGNAVNLALTYYASGDRVTGEARMLVEGRFDNLVDVIMHDPLRIAVTYAKDAMALLKSGLARLLEPPLGLFIGAGVVALLVVRHDPITLGLVAVLLAQVLLVNAKAFDVRFYLFLLPLLGAGLAVLARMLAAWADHLRVRRAIAGGLAVCALVAVAAALAQAFLKTNENQAELREAVPAAQKALPAGATVMARKPHVAFFAGVTWVWLPDLPSMAALSTQLGDIANAGPVFLYYGSSERAFRPQLAGLAKADQAPDRFVVEAQGDAGGGWVLYRYECPTGDADAREPGGCH